MIQDFLPHIQRHLLQLPETFPHKTRYWVHVCASGSRSRPPNVQQRHQPLSSSPAKVTCDCWDSELKAEVNGGFFSLTYSRIIALLEQWEWRALWRSLPDTLVKTPSRCQGIKAKASWPCKRTFVEHSTKREGTAPKVHLQVISWELNSCLCSGNRGPGAAHVPESSRQPGNGNRAALSLGCSGAAGPWEEGGVFLDALS